MNPRLPLLLNLIVLIVTVVVVVAHTESQDRVLRVTTRMACESPPPLRWPVRQDAQAGDPEGGDRAEEAGASPGAISGAIGQLSHIRLLKYLARVDGIDQLSADQLEAVYAALEECCHALVEAERSVRTVSGGGAGARRAAAAARSRVEDAVAHRLRAADVPDGALLARLVRVVVSSAG